MRARELLLCVFRDQTALNRIADETCVLCFLIARKGFSQYPARFEVWFACWLFWCFQFLFLSFAFIYDLNQCVLLLTALISFHPPKAHAPEFSSTKDQWTKIWSRSSQNLLIASGTVSVIFDGTSFLQIDSSRCFHISDPNMAANGKNKSSKNAETPV